MTMTMKPLHALQYMQAVGDTATTRAKGHIAPPDIQVYCSEEMTVSLRAAVGQIRRSQSLNGQGAEL